MARINTNAGPLSRALARGWKREAAGLWTHPQHGRAELVMAIGKWVATNAAGEAVGQFQNFVQATTALDPGLADA